MQGKLLHTVCLGHALVGLHKGLSWHNKHRVFFFINMEKEIRQFWFIQLDILISLSWVIGDIFLKTFI